MEENVSSVFESNLVAAVLDVNPFANVRDIVYDAIKEAILLSRYQPGEKLVISQIANDLRVSITPVREAMDKLCDAGLVVSTLKESGKQKNYAVFQLSDSDVEDLFVARKAIETMAAYVCASRNWKVDLNRLDKLASDFNSALTESVHTHKHPANKTLFLDLDRDFHRLIVNATGNKYLIRAYGSVEDKINYLSVQTCAILRHNSADQLRTLGAQHIALANAIRYGFPDQAQQLSSEHIDFCMNSALVKRYQLR